MKQIKKQFQPIAKSIVANDSQYGGVSGYASTFDDLPDRDGDRVRPGAAGTEPFSAPMLAYHDRKMPCGSAQLTPDMQGLYNTASFSNTQFAQDMREYVKSGAIPAFSIGFSSSEYTENEFGGVDFHKIEVYEVSLVPIPANPRALVSMAKSFDIETNIKKDYQEIDPMVGSYEAVQEDVEEALSELYPGCCLSIVSTYPDMVIYSVTTYTDGAPPSIDSYQVDYVWLGEDDVTIGEPQEVEISMVVTPETDTEEVSQAPLVQAAAAVSNEAIEKNAGVVALKQIIKNGRRNSTTDQVALDQAHEYIVKAGAVCEMKHAEVEESKETSENADTSEAAEAKTSEAQAKQVSAKAAAIERIHLMEIELAELEMAF